MPNREKETVDKLENGSTTHRDKSAAEQHMDRSSEKHSKRGR